MKTIKKQYEQLKRDLHMHDELGLRFSYRCTLTTIKEMEVKYPFLNEN